MHVYIYIYIYTNIFFLLPESCVSVCIAHKDKWLGTDAVFSLHCNVIFSVFCTFLILQTTSNAKKSRARWEDEQHLLQTGRQQNTRTCTLSFTPRDVRCRTNNNLQKL